jgi:hypothetical protein
MVGRESDSLAVASIMSEMEKRKQSDVDSDSLMDDSNDTPSQQPPSKRGRSLAPIAYSHRPSVNGLIKEDAMFGLILDGLTPDRASNNEQRARILLNVFATVATDPHWRNVLNADFKDLDKCKKAVNDNKGLAEAIDKCIKSGDWQPLFDDPSQFFRRSLPCYSLTALQVCFIAEVSPRPRIRIILRRTVSLLFYLFSSGHLPVSLIQCNVRPAIFLSRTLIRVQQTSRQRLNTNTSLLLTAMDLYVPDETTNYYNRSFSIVQSSGMGKSRLMDHSATLRFTLPFNLHERMGWCSKSMSLPFLVLTYIYYLLITAYPPCDHNVRNYLTDIFDNEVSALTRPLVFLQALFKETFYKLESYKAGTPEEIARQWYDWMKEGSTVDKVGTNRSLFYDRVIEKAKAVRSVTTFTYFNSHSHFGLSWKVNQALLSNPIELP